MTPTLLRTIWELPAWVPDFLANGPRTFEDDQAKMLFAIALARQNVEQTTGGPFGAAVLEITSGRIVSVGVNLVEASRCSLAHAEMVAIALAQGATQSFDLGGRGRPPCELVTSTEPCAMCLGAIPWSGLRRVVCGARDEDARAIGFDEGAKPVDWAGELQKRGIAVARDVLGEQARNVLEQYAQAGRTIYNACRDS